MFFVPTRYGRLLYQPADSTGTAARQGVRPLAHDRGRGAAAGVRLPRAGRRLMERGSVIALSYSVRGGELVLRLRVEVAGVVALVQLLGGVARKPVDHAPAPHRRPFQKHVGPALDVLVLVH